MKELPSAVEQGSNLLGLSAVGFQRRLGRLKTAGLDLVPLLRSPATASIRKPSSGKAGPRFIDGGSGLVRGFIFALALSVPLWAGIGALLWVAL